MCSSTLHVQRATVLGGAGQYLGDSEAVLQRHIHLLLLSHATVALREAAAASEGIVATSLLGVVADAAALASGRVEDTQHVLAAIRCGWREGEQQVA